MIAPVQKPRTRRIPGPPGLTSARRAVAAVLFNRPQDAASAPRSPGSRVWRLLVAIACLAIALQAWRVLSFE
jgi:hypothetical protein